LPYLPATKANCRQPQVMVRHGPPTRAVLQTGRKHVLTCADAAALVGFSTYSARSYLTNACLLNMIALFTYTIYNRYRVSMKNWECKGC